MSRRLVLCSLLWIPVSFAQTPPQPADIAVVSGNEAKHARHADARHCLDLKTDAQIIRCADRYRWRR